MTSTPSDAAYSFGFAAPDETPSGWGLSRRGDHRGLTEVDPQAIVERGTGSLSFEATFPFGWIEGGATCDPGAIRLGIVTVGRAARFAGWLRARLRPAGASVLCLTTEGIELGHAPAVRPTSAPSARC